MSKRSEWVSVTLKNGECYEGTIESEAAYGIYLHLNGVKDRLALFAWHTIDKVVSRETETE